MASRSHVAHMKHGDFYHGEKSMTVDHARDVKMELVTQGGKTIVLKPKVSLLDGEIIDSMFMSKKALCDFYEEQMEDARKTGVMFSLHVKATMMKVSHPIVFGHAVKNLLQGSLREARQAVRGTGRERQQRPGQTCTRSWKPCPHRSARKSSRDMHACHEHRPELAMVDSAKGISNLHAPNDVIVDASIAGHDPHRRQDVGCRRPSEGHQGRDPGEHVCAHLPGDHQLLQDQRQLRSGHHGHRAQRRADGPAGRGIRLARQDLRNPGSRRSAHRRHRHG